MTSTFTRNLGIELPADGELDGVWGDVTNENMDILDRAINGVQNLSLSGTSSTLTTSDGALSDGQYKLLRLGGSPSGTHTITIDPDDAEKIYFVQNNTAQTVEFNQGSGANAIVFAGDSAIVYANGSGGASSVENLTDTLGMDSVNITGGSITGLDSLGLSAATPFIYFAENDTTDKDARISLSAGTLVFSTVTDANVLVRENMRIESGGNVGIGTSNPATFLEVASSTQPTAAFIAFISGTTMTVTGITSGALAVGDRVFAAGVEWNTVIQAQLTGTTGASGTYQVSNSQTVSTAPTGIGMDSFNAGKSVLRLTNTDTGEVTNQTTGAVEFFSSDAVPNAGVKGYVAVISEDTTPSSAMLFGTSGDTGNAIAVERMRIDSSGNVGIGRTAPASTLDVNGDLTITDKIIHSGDTNTAIRFPAADTVTVETAGLERMRIDSSGDVAIGRTTPASALDVNGDLTITDKIIHSGDTNTSIRFPSADTVTVETAGVERMRISSAGNVGIGTTPLEALDVVGVVAATGGFIDTGTDSTATQVIFSGFRSGDGSQTGGAVRIRSVGDGSGDAVQMIFDTDSTEAMRINAAGTTLVGKTTSNLATAGVELFQDGTIYNTVSANTPLVINRLADDGTLISFRQAGTQEGRILVSGTSVTLEGAHLSRPAQFTDNSRPALLKGTVMSNLDQMSYWENEDNEQLNCVQVSTVEGDANVAGVFLTWDDDAPEYNDIVLSMTGDMVIRIAAGTTVQRGDLLMSAGDGTAKPQGDDIVRSKTIAKVTSTHVSHNYADGSYAVPCVLMAC